MLDCPIVCGARRQKMTVRNEQTQKSEPFSKARHKHYTPVAVFATHTVTSLIYFSMIYARQWKYATMPEKSTHLQVIPQQSNQITANLPLPTCEKNQWTFLLCDTGVDFSSRNNFTILGFFAEVSIPVGSIIFCIV